MTQLHKQALRFLRKSANDEIDLLSDNGKTLPTALENIDLFNPYAILLRYEEIEPTPPPIDRDEFRSLIRQLKEWVTNSIK
jgi:hypothetical protein